MEPILERFLSKVKVADSGCWEWTSTKAANGYGGFWNGVKPMSSHRFIYKYYYGSIDSELTIDHLCRNRICVNPNHLEQITRGENVLRGISFSAINAKKTHCVHGHPLEPNNLQNNKHGHRVCKMCRSRYDRNRYRDKKLLQ